ncbi:WD repeat and FYVE domain-containing protein 3 [Armadillidium vulgare]|nr:WD repeat and FYVE domain-containing protein 3 [Armadillidium vulgare]
MGSILGLLHTAQPTDLQLKTDILKTLLLCLKESHRTRTVFRKVGGFVYLMSVIVGLEGSMGDEPLPLWVPVNQKLILGLLITVFNALTIAMRYEPANAKFFHQEFCPGSLCSTLKMLNCFSNETKISDASESPWKELLSPSVSPNSAADINTFHTIFITPVVEYSPPPDMPTSLVRVVQVLQLLYHMALDSFDKPLAPNFYFPHLNKSPSQGRLSDSSPGGTKRPSSGLNLAPTPSEPVIVHPGVVVTMLHLLPSIQHSDSPTLAAILQLYAAHLLKSLVRSEKNQQVMCEADLGGEILELSSIALHQENHPLHPIVQYIFERLAAQAILPKDLRTFLRLGDPLNCFNLDDIDVIKGEASHRGPVPLTRIKTLVSMTTPKDIRVGPQVFPSFVEFDMSAEGFGCLFLPSIAPQSVGGTSVVTSALTNTEVNVIGGIGSGDRIFPPQTGLTYSSWFCVEKYSDPRTDPHFVRLLTIARQISGRSPLTCLAVGISARDKALLISTHETNLPQSGQNVTEWEPEILGDFGCRVWCPDLLSEGQWHHLALTVNRAVLKNSSLSVYIDGQLINQQRLHYILQNPGGGAANLTVASSVYAYIGTPPVFRRHSRLVWRQGPCHLLEDVLQANMISLLYQLGPHYTGCLQAPRFPGCEASGPIVPEDKIVLGLNATALSYLTLNKIRKVYSKVDNKAIAKQLGMSSHENATPIRILHNSAGHLSGGSRTLGGVVVGYLGVRVFCPRPVAAMIQTVGGCSVLLGLVAMSKDVESLYASVKALSCVVKASKMG